MTTIKGKGENIMTEQKKEQTLRVYEYPDFYVEEGGNKYPACLAVRSVSAAAKTLGVSRYKFIRRARETEDYENVVAIVLANPGIPIVEINGHILPLSDVFPDYDIHLSEETEAKEEKPNKEQQKEKGLMNVD